MNITTRLTVSQVSKIIEIERVEQCDTYQTHTHACTRARIYTQPADNHILKTCDHVSGDGHKIIKNAMIVK